MTNVVNIKQMNKKKIYIYNTKLKNFKILPNDN